MIAATVSPMISWIISGLLIVGSTAITLVLTFFVTRGWVE